MESHDGVLARGELEKEREKHTKYKQAKRRYMCMPKHIYTMGLALPGVIATPGQIHVSGETRKLQYKETQKLPKAFFFFQRKYKIHCTCKLLLIFYYSNYNI
jgi:hypothetical protein